MRKLSLRVAGECLIRHFLWLMPSLESLAVEKWSKRYICQDVPFNLESSRPNFVKLEFSGTRIRDRVLIKLLNASQKSLQDLRLDGCRKLTRETWTAVGNCVQLRHLSIPRVRDFEDRHLEKILLNAPDLEFLNLKHIRGITFQGFKSVQKLRRLRDLTMPDCSSIDDETWSTLGKFQSLRHLDFTTISCEIGGFRRIKDLKELRTLKLGSRENAITTEHFTMICENFKKLERLDIHELTAVNGEGLHLLEHLSHLLLRSASEFTNNTFGKGLGSQAMETISLEGATITNDALASIAARHPRLKNLELGNCGQVTDEGFEALIRAEPYLKRLQLMGCPLLTDESLRTLNSLCPSLEMLRIRNSRISEHGVDRFKKQRPWVALYCYNR